MKFASQVGFCCFRFLFIQRQGFSFVALAVLELSVDQTGLELTEICLPSASCVLGLNAAIVWLDFILPTPKLPASASEVLRVLTCPHTIPHWAQVQF